MIVFIFLLLPVLFLLFSNASSHVKWDPPKKGIFSRYNEKNAVVIFSLKTTEFEFLFTTQNAIQ